LILVVIDWDPFEQALRLHNEMALGTSDETRTV
jgi:hypothetical protein